MPMVVKNNMSALATLNTLNKNSSSLQESLEKVSSGMKINTAKDDASGYAISERMRVQIRALDQANQNTENGQSLMKVAEGAVSSTIEILKTLKEKAINSATDTNTDDDRKTIQKEVEQFLDQIDDNALVTFNGKYLVDGSKSMQVDSAVATAITNEALSANTRGDTNLTALKSRKGDSLEIVTSDKVTASFVYQGVTYTTKFKVGTDSNLSGIFAKLNSVAPGSVFSTSGGVGGLAVGSEIGVTASGSTMKTANGESAITITASTAGLDGQISGLNISISDQNGQVKKTANEFLNQFKTSIFAANSSEDYSLKIHTGADASQSIAVSLEDMRTKALGLRGSDGSVIQVTTQDQANAAVSAFDNALRKALDQSTTIGAIEARLDYTASNLTTSNENVQAAESTIRDADMAKEMTAYTKNNVLLQAAQSMLAQANQNSSAVLSLLQ